MPARQTARPAIIICPCTDQISVENNSPEKSGGTKVPNAAVKPRTIAIPRDSPRYRMVNPKVRPPNPHRKPKRMHSSQVRLGVAARTPKRSCVLNIAKSQGAMTQLNTPPTSQKISQDQQRTFRKGT